MQIFFSHFAYTFCQIVRRIVHGGWLPEENYKIDWTNRFKVVFIVGEEGGTVWFFSILIFYIDDDFNGENELEVEQNVSDDEWFDQDVDFAESEEIEE